MITDNETQISCPMKAPREEHAAYPVCAAVAAPAAARTWKRGNVMRPCEDAKYRKMGLALLGSGCVICIAALMAGDGVPGQDLRGFVCGAGVVIALFGAGCLFEITFIRARMKVGTVALEIWRDEQMSAVLAGVLQFSPPLKPDQVAQSWEVRIGMDVPHRYQRPYRSDMFRVVNRASLAISPSGESASFRVQVPAGLPPSSDPAFETFYLDLMQSDVRDLELRFELPRELAA